MQPATLPMDDSITCVFRRIFRIISAQLIFERFDDVTLRLMRRPLFAYYHRVIIITYTPTHVVILLSEIYTTHFGGAYTLFAFSGKSICGEVQIMQ